MADDPIDDIYDFGEGPSRKFAAFAIISTEYPYRQAHPKDKLIVSLEEISHEAEDLIRELKDPEPDAKIDAGFVWSFYVYPNHRCASRWDGDIHVCSSVN